MNRPAPHAIRRVLLAGRPGRQLRGVLENARPDLEIRVSKVAEVTAADLEWADAYVGFRPPPVSLTGVRWVHSAGAGVDAYLGAEAIPEGTVLTRTTGEFGRRIGEYCLARVLAFCQHMSSLREAQERHEWLPLEPRELSGTRALIVGTGTVGSGIAQILRALGCRLTGVSRSGTQKAPFDDVHTTAALPELVADHDWIILAVPLTHKSGGLIGPSTLSSCRGGCLVNVARGGVLDYDALLDALDHGRLAGAALDVFPEEPLPPESPLWDRRDVVISPHVAAMTTVEEASRSFLESLEALEEGRQPPLAVDPERGY